MLHHWRENHFEALPLSSRDLPNQLKHMLAGWDQAGPLSRLATVCLFGQLKTVSLDRPF